MRKLITITFVTMEGVMLAPGGPEEDPSKGFKYGGWSANYQDKIAGDIIDGIMGMPFELLLGRRAYDIFAGYWPTANKDSTVTAPFNANKKYVVSHTAKELAWHNSTLITGDVVAAIEKLKAESGPDLWVWGSGVLIQTLLKAHLVDRMHLWTYPVTVGNTGQHLFAEGTQADGFKLIDSKVTTKGVILATYEPAGPLKVGIVGS